VRNLSFLGILIEEGFLASLGMTEVLRDMGLVDFLGGGEYRL